MLRIILTPEKSDCFGLVRTRELGVPEAIMLTTRPPKPLKVAKLTVLASG